MNLLTILYGCQYEEIAAKGKDGNHGRLNANVFLTLLLAMVITIVMLAVHHYSPDFLPRDFVRSIKSRTAAKIFALAGFGLLYLLVMVTVGTQKNFQQRVTTFKTYPDSLRKKANVILLTTFFILLALVIVAAFMFG